MIKLKNLAGQRFGRLLALAPIKKKGRNWVWICVCDCGTAHLVAGGNLGSGTTKSCGCWPAQIWLQLRTTHNLSKHPLYRIFHHMKDRCTNPRDPQYPDYGGRGITLQWQSFEAFYADMVPTYQPGLSIERRLNNGPYSKQNCYWATPYEQANNKRNNRRITYKRKTLTLAQWARLLNMDYRVLHHRLKLGWSIHKAFTTPIGKRH